MKKNDDQESSCTDNEAYEQPSQTYNPTYEQIDQGNTQYDQVVDAVSFQENGGVATTLYNDGTNSVA